MANTTQAHKALLKAFGIKELQVFISIPNKIIRKTKGSKRYKRENK